MLTGLFISVWKNTCYTSITGTTMFYLPNGDVFLSRGFEHAWLDLTRTTVDTMVELPILHHDFTLVFRISLLLQCVFLLLLCCDISLLHSRVLLFVHRRWVTFTHHRRFLLLFQVTSVFWNNGWIFFWLRIYFLASRAKRFRWYFSENGTTSITSKTCKQIIIQIKYY